MFLLYLKFPKLVYSKWTPSMFQVPSSLDVWALYKFVIIIVIEAAGNDKKEVLYIQPCYWYRDTQLVIC